MFNLILGDGRDHVPNAEELLAELRTLKKRGVFTTNVRLPARTYEIITTSQQLHLDFGKLSEIARKNFCIVVEEAMEQAGDTTIVFGFDYKTDKERERTWLVTRALYTELHAIYHISAAGDREQ